MHPIDLVFGKCPLVAPIFEPECDRALVIREAFALIDIDKFNIAEQIIFLRYDRLPDRVIGDISRPNKLHFTHDPGKPRHRPVISGAKMRRQKHFKVKLRYINRLSKLIPCGYFIIQSPNIPDRLRI